jgi:hypothetical protein
MYRFDETKPSFRFLGFDGLAVEPNCNLERNVTKLPRISGTEAY